MSTTLFITIYALLFLAVFFAIVIGMKKWHGRRWPLEDKLMRGPGETLRKELMKRQENEFLQVLKNIWAPLAVPVLLANGVAWMPEEQRWVGIVGLMVLFVVMLVMRMRALIKWWQDTANYELGYYGERVVAEHLEPLKGRGYAVFHDVPGSAGKESFNLDHVTVGPSGVVVVETKARRKQKSTNGTPDHKVIYDGRQLIWPWGADSGAVKQAGRNAQWLREWLKDRTGKDFEVTPIVALPGWWVDRTGRGTVLVMNPKSLPKAVDSGSKPVLNADEVMLISRQLATLCKDVE